jgi:hypothetical protein
LAASLNEMASSLQATTVSRVSLEKLIGAIDQIVVVSGQDGRVQLINPQRWQVGLLPGAPAA